MKRITIGMVAAVMCTTALGSDAFTLGYQLDAGRGKAPQMMQLRNVVDLLAKVGYTQFQLYNESTFAYTNHPSMQAGRPTYSAAEMRVLDKYCKAHGIELVPNQNSFGHLGAWLGRSEYKQLAEAPKGVHFTKPFTLNAGPMSLCATDPASVTFLAGLYDEFLPCFTSTKLNVGCDEVWDLLDPNCRSIEDVKKYGDGRVYLNFLLKIHGLLKERHHTMMFWADMVFRHPELVKELPKEDMIALDWGYEWNSPFENHAQRLEASGVPFYVCPGASSWCSLFGRVGNMMTNIAHAVDAAKKHGGKGMLIADWGDGYHPQPWIVSVPAIVYGAAYARGEKLDPAGLAAAIDKVLGCRCGEALVRYGNLYLKCGALRGNGTYLFDIWRLRSGFKPPTGMTAQTMADVFAERKAAAAAFDPKGAPQWVKDDFELLDLLGTVIELRWRGEHKAVRHLAGNYRDLWLKQNKMPVRAALTTPFGE